jgi:hypothetical protein
MRRSLRWLLIFAFVVVNCGIVVWVWRELSNATDEIRQRDQPSQSGADPSSEPEIAINPSATKEELGQASRELSANTDKMAYDLIAKWNRDPVIKLDSDELRFAVESLPEADGILLPEGAITLSSATLSEPVKQDLDSAVTGLLQSYRHATPEAVIKYMSGRGKVVDPNLRKRMGRALAKQGIDDLEKLTDEDVYRTMWTTFKASPHWSGLVADSSCRQFWNGNKVVFNLVQGFKQNFTFGVLPEQMEQAEYLVHLLRGTSSGPHNFVSTKGSLEDGHKSGAEVLLCDVQLIIELDESFSREKAPYLFRFWFNDALGKWQPIDKLRFNSNPKGGRQAVEFF